VYLPIVEEHLKKHKAIYDVAVQSNEFSIPPRSDDYINQFERSKKISEYKLCTNINITRGVNDTKISMGRSSIHGWGAFLKTNVEKNEFIMEYNGEIISQDEAERRGRIYDKVDSSYLFNLNQETAIDATRIGNKTKFINHDSNPNCEPKVLLVKGEHKVAFFAKEKMHAGQELTFNYGYTEQAAPKWTNPKSSSFINK
jgi:histone-lysine N-methyltransferase EZH2